MSKKTPPFCHLHVHSEYSLLDGANRIGDIAKVAAQQGSPAIALTDHGVMYGAIDHYQACLEQGVKPIIGCEVYVAPRKYTDKNAQLDSQKKTAHLTLWAKNLTGYKNLMKLTTRAHLEGFYYRPRVDHDLLAEYSEGIICGSACLGGEIPKLITNADLSEARHRAEKYREIFGKGNYFLELMDHDFPQQHEVNERIIDIHHQTNIPLIATNDAHFTHAGDEHMHKVLVCIGTNSTLDSASLHYGPNFYIKSPEEMWEKFNYVPEALENTMRIADMIDLELDLETHHFPKFDVPEGHNLESFLRFLCKQRFDKRYPIGSPRRKEAQKRMDYELDVIIQKGYAGYFLVVQDFINWSKERGILVGCRGSAAGCLVSYVLGITNLDPLPYGLLFERFLNPERMSMPDIDVDFPDKRREETLRYVSDKYGKDKVAQIITFGTLAARAAVKDTARTMGVDLDTANKVAKLIPSVPGHSKSIGEALAEVPELKNLYNSNGQIRELMDTAQQIEGFTRHASRHACGVVIGEDSLEELVPLEEKDGDILTQYHAKAAEAVGLVKMDFLGLQNNTVINDAVELIERRRGEKIDLENIDLTDQKVYDMLGRGDGVGVFQMEGSGMRNLLRQLRPQNLEHIIAQISLFRPGPMEEIPKYLEGRSGGKITYPHPKLKPVLEDTYGMFLYQEQVMRASQVLAGFTGGQADELRKAMGKKKHEVMAQMKPQFIDGCVKNGVSRKDATDIFERMEAFASYAFNKSHAAYYALVSYWTAYLKINYTPEFMACKMTSLLGNKEKLLVIIDDSRRHGVDVLAPDVNESEHAFTVTDGGIRFGLQAIKGIGRTPVDAIIEARKEGKFASLFDFCDRVSQRACGHSQIETLIRSGAFDSLHNNRQAMLNAVDGAMRSASQAQEDAMTGQMNIFGGAEEAEEAMQQSLPDIPDAPQEQRLAWEKELVGLYLSDHPLDPYRDYLESKTVPLLRIGEDAELTAGTGVTVGGIVTDLQKRIDKKGNNWASFTLEDLTGSVDTLTFARTFEKCGHLLQEDAKILIKGKLSEDNRRGFSRNNDNEDDSVEENVVYKIIVDKIVEIPEEAKDFKANPNAKPQKLIRPASKRGKGKGTSKNGNGKKHYARNAAPPKSTFSADSAPMTPPPFESTMAPPEDTPIPGDIAVQEETEQCVYLFLTADNANGDTISSLWHLCRAHKGDTEVRLCIDTGSQSGQMRVARDFYVQPNADFERAAAALLGENNVKMPPVNTNTAMAI